MTGAKQTVINGHNVLSIKYRCSDMLLKSLKLYLFCLHATVLVFLKPALANSIPARYHTFMEIDHEIISTVILLPSADLFKKGCCQLQAKVCAQITG